MCLQNFTSKKRHTGKNLGGNYKSLKVYSIGPPDIIFYDYFFAADEVFEGVALFCFVSIGFIFGPK